MKGVAYLGNGRVEVREYPVPKPGPGEVLVELKSAGICGSDLHKYHRDEEWAEARNGMIAGHEGAGVVVALGPGIEDSVPMIGVGDRVSIYHSLGCGRCAYCLEGMPVFCRHEGAFGRTRDGCHANYVTAPASMCLPLPDACSFPTGALLACTAGTAYAAVMKLGLQRRDPAAIFGLGPVGLSSLLVARALDYEAYGIDIQPYRIALAERVAPGKVIDGSIGSVPERILEATDGIGVAGAIECSGSGRARADAVASTRVRGTVVLVGVGDQEMPIDPERIIRKELSLRGNAVYSTGDYFRAVDSILTHRLDLDTTITHRFPISDAVEAFSIFDTGKTGKVVFEW